MTGCGGADPVIHGFTLIRPEIGEIPALSVCCTYATPVIL